MEISAKIEKFFDFWSFESVRFKRKRGRVERVQAGLAVEEGGEASNPPRGGGGETEVDRSAAGAQRAAANEGSQQEQPKNLVHYSARDKKKVEKRPRHV